MLHRHHMVWTDRDGSIGLRRDVLEQLTTAVISAVHVRHTMDVVHVVHDVEITHLIIGGASVRKITIRHEQTTSTKCKYSSKALSMKISNRKCTTVAFALNDIPTVHQPFTYSKKASENQERCFETQ